MLSFSLFSQTLSFNQIALNWLALHLLVHTTYTAYDYRRDYREYNNKPFYLNDTKISFIKIIYFCTINEIFK